MELYIYVWTFLHNLPPSLGKSDENDLSVAPNPFQAIKDPWNREKEVSVGFVWYRRQIFFTCGGH